MPFRHWLAATLALAAAPVWAQLDVNRASAEDLDTLKGIGPALAARIVQARAERPFRDWADLQARVRGLGPTTAARLSDQGLTVGGARHPNAGELLYVPMQPQPVLATPGRP